MTLAAIAATTAGTTKVRLPPVGSHPARQIDSISGGCVLEWRTRLCASYRGSEKQRHKCPGGGAVGLRDPTIMTRTVVTAIRVGTSKDPVPGLPNARTL